MVKAKQQCSLSICKAFVLKPGQAVSPVRTARWSATYKISGNDLSTMAALHENENICKGKPIDPFIDPGQ